MTQENCPKHNMIPVVLEYSNGCRVASFCPACTHEMTGCLESLTAKQFQELAALRSQLQQTTEERGALAAILGPPGTTSATAADVLRWANFATIGLKLANEGLGDYRRRYEAAERELARVR